MCVLRVVFENRVWFDYVNGFGGGNYVSIFEIAYVR